MVSVEAKMELIKKGEFFGLGKNFIANINILGYMKNINLLQENDNFRCFC